MLVAYDTSIDPLAAIRELCAVASVVVVVDNAPGGHPGAAAWAVEPNAAVRSNANRGGLAGAYNVALDWLREHAPQTHSVVFVDEDSDVGVLRAFVDDPDVHKLLARGDVAAVAPAHRDRATKLRAQHLQLTRFGWKHLSREATGLHCVSFVINSMSVWRADALRTIGPHNEWLGVDHVDTEYCMRATASGLAIWLHGDHEFAQSIGARRAYRFLGRTLQAGGHSPSRRRSIGRTTAWLATSHLVRAPGFALLCIVRLGYEALGIVMAEDAKAAKLAALACGAARGLDHALRGALTRRH